MPELVVDMTPIMRIENVMDRLISKRLPNTEEAMRKSSVRLLSEWRNRASNHPGVYRRSDYLASLVPSKSIQQLDPLSIAIVSTNPDLARQVHKGVRRYDMKPDLVGTLRGQPRPSNPSRTGNAREIINSQGSVVGRYNVIPFRHKGLAGEAYKQAKALPPSATALTGTAKQKTKWGGRLSNAQIEAISASPATQRAYNVLVKAREARGLKKPTFEQFINRFRGMARVVKQYEKTAQAKYMTFRVVSVRTDGKGGSKAGSWIFPGWSGVNFPRETLAHLAQAVRSQLIQGLVLDLGA